VALAVAVVSVHAVVRAVTQKHWITDILGSYLLVAGPSCWLRRVVRPGLDGADDRTRRRRGA
jgi:membrane-associated phospholipid phosphatase